MMFQTSPMHIFRQDGGRFTPFAKHLGILSFVTFFFVLPFLCSNLRHSLYHRRLRSKKEEVTHMLTENNHRLKGALQVIQSYNRSFWSRKQGYLSKPPEVSWKIDVAITIVTVSRNRHKIDLFEPNYLTQVVGKYLEVLSYAKRKRYQMFLCNVDSDPLTYIEFQKLSSVFPAFQRFPNIKPTGRIKNVDIFEKEKEDYVYCLNQTLNKNADHVLLVEDDALPLDNFISILNHVIDFRLGRHLTRNEYGGSSSEIVYLKLYHPERLLGYYSLEYERIPELFATGVLFGALLSYIYRLFTASCTAKYRYQNNFYMTWMFFACFVMLAAICIGRQNLLELRRISEQLYLLTPTASCCTQAILYPRNGGFKVVAYLSKIRCRSGFAKDSALDKFRRDTGARAYMLQPNVYKHIGLYSSLRKEIVNPFAI